MSLFPEHDQKQRINTYSLLLREFTNAFTLKGASILFCRTSTYVHKAERQNHKQHVSRLSVPLFVAAEFDGAATNAVAAAFGVLPLVYDEPGG